MGEPTGTTTSGGQWSPGYQNAGDPGLLGNANVDGGVGVVGQAESGMGVFGDTGSGIGVEGDTLSGVGVAGISGAGGGGVVGLGGAGAAIEGGPDNITFAAGDTVGVYGSVQTFQPSATNVSCGVWGDARDVTGVLGSSSSGAGISGISAAGVGGVFQSGGPQLRLVPSSVPLADSQLMQTGQVGDLYLFSVAQEVGTSGTYDYTTILWLCIAPAVPGGQAMWAQVQLGDTAGG